MANELGKHKAAIAKALFDEGRNGQEIQILFGVNSRATSQIKGGEEYSNVAADRSHGIPSEIFELSLYDIFRVLGADNIRKIHEINKKLCLADLKNLSVSDMTAMLDEHLKERDERRLQRSIDKINKK